MHKWKWKWKKAVAWCLVTAILAGNVTQLGFNTAYAAEQPGITSEMENGSELLVQIDQAEIETVLQMAESDRPKLDTDMIPFEGGKKAKAEEFLQKELSDKILIAQDGDEERMYLIVAEEKESGGQDDQIGRIQLIGINGNEYEDCVFRLQVIGDQLNFSEAAVTRYDVVQAEKKEMEELIKEQGELVDTSQKSTPSDAKDSSQEVKPATDSNAEGPGQEVKPATDSNAGPGQEGETTAPEPGNSETIAPEPGSPETIAPESGSPETTAPESGSPETTAPESGSPETIAPESGSTETIAPETGKQETIGSETEGISQESKKDSAQSKEEQKKSAAEDKTEQLSADTEKAEKEIIEEETEAKKEKETKEEKETEEEKETKEETEAAEEVVSDDLKDKSEVTDTDKTGQEDDRITKDNTFVEDEEEEEEEEPEIPEEALLEADLIDDIHAVEIFKNGNPEELSEEELQLLNSMKEAPKTAVFMLQSLMGTENLQEESYQLMVGPSQISFLDMQNSAYTTVFDLAKELYEDNQEPIARVTVSPSVTGAIKAGETFQYQIKCTVNPIPTFEFRTQDGPKEIFEEIKPIRIHITVPKQIVLEGVTETGTTEKDHTYTYTIEKLGQGESKETSFNAYIAENGKLLLDTQLGMPEVTFEGGITIRDLDSGETKPYQNLTYAEITVPEEELWVDSADQWGVEKKLVSQKDSNGDERPYLRVTEEGADSVKLVYQIGVGLLGPDDTILKDDASYFRAGRAAFGDYKLTDTLTAEGIDGSVVPSKVKIELVNGSASETVTDSAEITLGDYRHLGNSNGDTSTIVDSSAPIYSEYLVTAYYPYEKFVLDFWDSRLGDGEHFPVKNQVKLDYSLAAVGEGRGTASGEAAASTTVQFTQGYQKITLKQAIEIPSYSGMQIIPYDKDQSKGYTGWAAYGIYKLGADDVPEETPYAGLRIQAEDGSFAALDSLMINPLMDEKDEETSVSGEDGSITFYVEPGKYQIRQLRQPDDTKTEDPALMEPADVTARDATVEFINKATGKGGVWFNKQGQQYENGQLVSKPLAGAAFGIYEKGKPELIQTAVSDSVGRVSFNSLKPGEYTVKELSAGNSAYITDTKEYPVVIEENITVELIPGGNTLVNKSNSGQIRISQLLQDEKGFITLPAGEISNFKSAYTVEKKTGADSWLGVTNYHDLGKDGNVIIPLPAYELTDGVADITKPITYRITQKIPSGGYTAQGLTADGQTTGMKGTVSYAYSKEFTLNPETADQEIKMYISHLGNFKVYVYKMSFSTEASKPMALGGKNFWLYKKTLSGYERVSLGETKEWKSAANGTITVSGLPLLEADGTVIEYYWYEANAAAGETVYGYTEQWKNGSTPTMMKGASLDSTLTGDVTGGFKLQFGKDTNAYIYNVDQRLPYWLEAKDIFSNIRLTDGTYTVYKVVDGIAESTAYNGYANKKVTDTDKAAFMLEPGTYRFQEVTVPAGHLDYKTSKGLDNNYQDVTVQASVEMGVAIDKAKHTVTFENEPKKKITLVKNVYGLDNSGAGKTPEKPKNILFEVYKATESGGVESTSVKINSNTPYTFEAGIYYFKELSQMGMVDPETYLEKDKDYILLDDGTLLFGPFEVKRAAKDDYQEDLTYTVDNYKNVGGITVSKEDLNTGESLKGATIVLGTVAADGTVTKLADSMGRITMASSSYTFINLPVYDSNGTKIRYRVWEEQAPEGYLLDSTTYDVTLEKCKTVTAGVKDAKNLAMDDLVQQKGELIKFRDAAKISITTQKFWYDTWQANFIPEDKIMNPLGDVSVALYMKAGDTAVRVKNPDGTAVEAKTTASDGTVTFGGLDRENVYYMIEAAEHPVYNMPGDKVALNSFMEDGTLLDTISNEQLERTNYVEFSKANFKPEEQKAASFILGPIKNEKSWVQFHVTKTAEESVVKQEDTPTEDAILIDGIPYTKNPLEQPEKVDGAKFKLYVQDKADLTPSGDSYVLTPDVLAEMTPVGEYESGTRLGTGNDGAEYGEQQHGEFMTKILEPGKIYWFVEESAPGGYLAVPEQKYTALVPQSEIGSFIGDGFSLLGYEKNKTNDIGIQNYKNYTPGEGGGGYRTFLKLNKWMQNGTEYTPLGGVTFELRLDGERVATLVTGLDNKLEGAADTDKVPTGTAMSGMLDVEALITQLTAKLASEGRSEELSQFVSGGNEDGKSWKSVKLELVETAAPPKVQYESEPHEVTLKAVAGENNVNGDYFYEEGKAAEETNIRLVNTLLANYPVTVRSYGFRATEEMFNKYSVLTDELLEQMDQTGELDKKILAGSVKDPMIFGIERKKIDGTWEAYALPRGAHSSGKNLFQVDANGSFRFPDGLPQGEYRLWENKTVNDTYGYLHSSNSKRRLYFTVKSDQADNDVNVYNPELPVLKLKFGTLSESTASFDKLYINAPPVLKKELLKGQKEAEFWKNANLSVEVMLSINSGGTKDITTDYFKLYYPNKGLFTGGYSSFLTCGLAIAGSETATIARGEKTGTLSLPLQDLKEQGYYAEYTIKLPRTAALTIRKVDAQKEATPLQGATFNYSYAPFTNEDFNIINGEPQLKSEVIDGTKDVTAYSYSGSTITDPTNEQGLVTIPKLKPGWYKISEKTAPAGYTKTEEVRYVAIVSDMAADHVYVPEAMTEFGNKAEVSLTVEKSLDYGKLIYEESTKPVPSSVTFEVYKGPAAFDEDQLTKIGGESLVFTEYGTGTGKTRSLPQLEDGSSYYLKEIVTDSKRSWNLASAVSGETPLTVIQGSQNQFIQLNGFTDTNPVSVKAVNQSVSAQVVVRKVDMNQAPLEGAVFELYAVGDDGQSAGKLLQTSALTGKNGEIIFDVPLTGMEGGSYFIKEKTAPANYILSAEAVRVELKPGTVVSYEGEGGVPGLSFVNYLGSDVTLQKYADVYGAGKPERQKSDAVFDLYSRKLNPGEGEDTSWSLEGNATADSDGVIQWKGLEAGTKEYAVSERPITSGAYQNYELESIHRLEGETPAAEAEAVETAQTIAGVDGTRDLYLLGSMTPGTAYVFNAYDRPAAKVTIRKMDVKEDAQTVPEARFEILDGSSQVVIDSVITKAVQGQKYSEAVIQLKPGSYQIKELETLTQGYQLVADDSRVETHKAITVPDAATQDIYTFKNLAPKQTLSLTKEVTEGQSLQNLWWVDNQKVKYAITPTVTNDLPLKSFVLSDTGIQMYEMDGGQLKELPEALRKNQYTYTSISIPVPKTDDFMAQDGDGGSSIKAKVELYDFEDNLVGIKEEVISDKKNANGNWVIDLSKETAKISRFDISYRDSRLENYTLGQNFTPGTIGVEVKLFRQNTDPAAQSIRSVKNTAAVKMIYGQYSSTGEVIQDGELNAQAEASSQVAEPAAPVIKISKSVENKTLKGQNVKVNDKLEYTLKLENVSTDTITPMERPVFIDQMPVGVELVKQADGTICKAETTGEVVFQSEEASIKTLDGRQYLYIPFSGSLKQGESITVTVSARVNEAVINNRTAIQNDVYVTSRTKKPAFEGNPGGAVFRVKNEAQQTKIWPELAPEGIENAAVKFGLSSKLGYAKANAANTFSSSSNMVLLKEIKGDQDLNYVTGNAAAKASANGNGTVTYRLTVKNTSPEKDAGTVITKLRVLDILPVTDDKRPLGTGARGSKWTLNASDQGMISAKKYDSQGNAEEITGISVRYAGENLVNPLDNKSLKQYLEGELTGWADIPLSGERTSALAFDFPSGFTLEPDQRAVIEFVTNVQGDISTDIIGTYATGDFVAQYSYKGNISDSRESSDYLSSNIVNALLTPEKVKVGGRIWIDANGNGIQDDQEYLSGDLKSLLDQNYFKVKLMTLSETTSDLLKVDELGAFQKDELIPARPYNENSLYKKSNGEVAYQLQPKQLFGSSPAHYQLQIGMGEDGGGIDGLTLKPSPTAMLENGKNPDSGKSRKPQDLEADNMAETKDSNFYSSGTSLISEDFFLWAADGKFDNSKDLGLIPYRDFSLSKVNQAGEPVKGTEFAVYGPYETAGEAQNADLTQEPVIKAQTGEDGKLKLAEDFAGLLYYKNYLVVETKAADNYDSAFATAETISADGTASVLARVQRTDQTAAWLLPSMAGNHEFSNQLKVTDEFSSGSLSFTKIDSLDKALLTGAEFTIEKTADSDKEFGNIKNAWSVFTSQIVNWTEEQKSAVGIADVSVKDGKLSFSMTTGEVTLTGIPYGHYILEETKAPANHLALTQGQNRYGFTLDKNQSSAVLSKDKTPVPDNAVENERAVYHLNLKKVNAAGKPLAGVNFKITGPGVYKDGISKLVSGLHRMDNTGYKENPMTDVDGILSLEGLTYGDYMLEETAPENYREAKPFYVRIAEDGTVSLLAAEDRADLRLENDSQDAGVIHVIMTNYLKSGTLKLEKLDGEGGFLDLLPKKLTGAVFRLTNSSTAEAGAWEDYQVIKPENGSGVEITKGSESGSIDIKMTAETAELRNLPYGTYTLTEIKAPDGYNLGTEPQTRTFTINDDQTTADFTGNGVFGLTLSNGGAIINEPTILTITKVDANFDYIRLQGAVFLLQNAEGQYVLMDNEAAAFTADKDLATRFETGEDGTVTIKRLPPGVYTILEEKAPLNYAVNEAIDPVTIEGIVNQEVTVKDNKSTSRAVINKVSSENTSQTLGGAVFGIFSEADCSDASKVTEITTGGDGRAVTGELPLGTYYVKELRAPEGYQLSGYVHTVTLTAQEQEFVVPGTNGEIYITNDPVRTGGGNSGGGGGSSDSGDNEYTTQGRRSSTTILDERIPLANLPNNPMQDNLITLIDQDVPLAGLPKTGGHQVDENLLIMLASALAALCLALSRKKGAKCKKDK